MHIQPLSKRVILGLATVGIASAISYTGPERALYTEYFNEASLTTRWMPWNTASPMQFDQNPNRWTMHMPQMMQLNALLPGHPTPGTRGLATTLSQSPCRGTSNCCSGSKCANWAGVHLETNTCYKYGRFDFYASVDMNPTHDAKHFFGIYVMAASN